jgi:hypothetical protein
VSHRFTAALSAYGPFVAGCSQAHLCAEWVSPEEHVNGYIWLPASHINSSLRLQNLWLPASAGSQDRRLKQCAMSPTNARSRPAIRARRIASTIKKKPAGAAGGCWDVLFNPICALYTPPPAGCDIQPVIITMIIDIRGSTALRV